MTNLYIASKAIFAAVALTFAVAAVTPTFTMAQDAPTTDESKGKSKDKSKGTTE